MTTGRINQVTIRSAKERAPTHRREKLIPPTTHRRCPSHRISKILRNARAFAPALELFRSPMLNRMLVRQMQFVHGAARRLQPPIGGQQLNDPRPFRAAHLVFAFLGKPSSTGSRGALRFNDADLAQSYPALPLRDCDPLRSLNRFRRGHHTRDCGGGAFGARFDRPSFRLPSRESIFQATGSVACRVHSYVCARRNSTNPPSVLGSAFAFDRSHDYKNSRRCARSHAKPSLPLIPELH